MLIVFEGIDGAGKTTQVQLLQAELTRRGQRVITLSNPGDSGVMVEDPERLGVYARTLYHVTALRQLIDMIIWPVTRRNIGTVLLDRGAYSTIAYQGYGEQQLNRTERIVFTNTTPQVRNAPTIWIDIPLEVAKFRSRDDEHQALYGRPGYMERVVDGYRKLAKDLGWYRVDGTKPPEMVHREIVAFVDNLQTPLHSATVPTNGSRY